MGKLGRSAKAAIVVALAACGFSVASIANGQSPMAMFETTTATQTATATTTVVSTTNSTTTVVVSRKVVLCHKTGSKKHPYSTIRVAQSSLRAHLRHGDAVGACTARTVKALKAKAAKAAKARAKARHRKHK